MLALPRLAPVVERPCTYEASRAHVRMLRLRTVRLRMETSPLHASPRKPPTLRRLDEHYTEYNMAETEVKAAVTFLCKILERNDGLSSAAVSGFERELTKLMLNRFSAQWYPEQPYRDSANRCIRVNFGVVDPLLVEAGRGAGITKAQLCTALPSELSLWIDPQCVCYRTSDRTPLFTVYDQSSGYVDSTYTPSEAGPTSPKVRFMCSPCHVLHLSVQAVCRLLRFLSARGLHFRGCAPASASLTAGSALAGGALWHCAARGMMRSNSWGLLKRTPLDAETRVTGRRISLCFCFMQGRVIGPGPHGPT